MQESGNVKKLFGFGTNIIYDTLICHLWSVPCMRKSGANRNLRYEGTIIFLCLLLSGDIHQCPSLTTRENQQRSLDETKSYLDVLRAFGKEDRRSGTTADWSYIAEL